RRPFPPPLDPSHDLYFGHSKPLLELQKEAPAAHSIRNPQPSRYTSQAERLPRKKLAPLRFDPLRFALLRSASKTFARRRFAPLRFAPLRFAPLRFAPFRSAPLRSSVILGFSSLQVFQELTPSRSLFRWSGSAIAASLSGSPKA